eukprot:scaffold57430_cov77-Cyclotella_meneghiniana.AAC.1
MLEAHCGNHYTVSGTLCARIAFTGTSRAHGPWLLAWALSQCGGIHLVSERRTANKEKPQSPALTGVDVWDSRATSYLTGTSSWVGARDTLSYSV